MMLPASDELATVALDAKAFRFRVAAVTRTAASFFVCHVSKGLSPAISIEQKSTSHNPRSTVGTITEIHDYLRLLYARVGTPRCPDHGFPLEAQTVSQMVDQVLAMPTSPGAQRWMLLAPVVRERKGEHAAGVRPAARAGLRARARGRRAARDRRGAAAGDCARSTPSRR
jgi:excinuclease UvrABC ATPase subunit